jgi:hypothetical protein
VLAARHIYLRRKKTAWPRPCNTRYSIRLSQAG